METPEDVREIEVKVVAVQKGLQVRLNPSDHCSSVHTHTTFAAFDRGDGQQRQLCGGNYAASGWCVQRIRWIVQMWCDCQPLEVEAETRASAADVNRL
jgi:hypothetical protein